MQKKIEKALMNNRSSWKTWGTLATYLLAPGFQISVMALATL